jgi:hypothetical protein
MFRLKIKKRNFSLIKEYQKALKQSISQNFRFKNTKKAIYQHIMNKFGL